MKKSFDITIGTVVALIFMLPHIIVASIATGLEYICDKVANYKLFTIKKK